jgi:hypothetical protein
MMNNFPSLTMRGRVFTENDLAIIKSCLSENYHLGRTYISRQICEKLNWRQPNGWLKDRACRDVLRILDERGIINLPPPLVRDQNKEKRKSTIPEYRLLNEYDLITPISEFPRQIEFVFAKGNSYEKIWNILVEKYHYLGHHVAVGRAIKYLVLADDKILGAICFSSASWHLSQRDNLLAVLGISQPRDYVINNSRFLILPNVKVKNLASCILALATRQVSIDWSSYYSITPLLAETFVQPSLFDGTCYRAANWIEIGTTKGYAKRGSLYRNSQEPKLIFVYGLNRNVRRKITKIILDNQV